MGGEPMFDNSGEGSGVVENPVMTDGQSCEISTSIDGEVAEDTMVERGAPSPREDVVLDSNFETVCDVK
jgi:hypothetical protein